VYRKVLASIQSCSNPEKFSKILILTQKGSRLSTVWLLFLTKGQQKNHGGQQKSDSFFKGAAKTTLVEVRR
jgi:hypothetical protein